LKEFWWPAGGFKNVIVTVKRWLGECVLIDEAGNNEGRRGEGARNRSAGKPGKPAQNIK
jgi:hypothetical protein